MYSWDESLNHFSLSVLPLGATQKVTSCTGLEGISLDTQFMQSETPHCLDFAGIGGKMCFYKIPSGVIFAKPNCFENGNIWKHNLCDSLAFQSGYLHGFTLQTRLQDEVVCPFVWWLPVGACLPQESGMVTGNNRAEIPTEISMSHSIQTGLGWGCFTKK